MKIAAKCEKCLIGRALVHTTIEHTRYIVRYRKCDVCHETSKTIQMIPVLNRNQSVEPNVDTRDTLRVTSEGVQHNDTDRTENSSCSNQAWRDVAQEQTGIEN